MTEKSEKEESSFDKFASAALRGPKATVYQQLLAGLLVKANSTSDQLKKIQTICEAALLAKDKGKLDMQFVDLAYTISSCLMKAQVTKDLRNGVEFVSVPWSFPLTEDNYRKYVEPWFTVELHYFPLLTRLRRQKYILTPVFDYYSYDAQTFWERKQEVTKEIHDEVKSKQPFEKFFIKTEVLAAESFSALKGEFEKWALTQLLTLQVAIAEQVKPEVYSEAFKLMFGEKRKEEVEAESEDTMGSRERPHNLH